MSISEPQGIATVHFSIPAGNGIPRTNDTLEVPLSRLQPPSSEVSYCNCCDLGKKLVIVRHSYIVHVFFFLN